MVVPVFDQPEIAASSGAIASHHHCVVHIFTGTSGGAVHSLVVVLWEGGGDRIWQKYRNKEVKSHYRSQPLLWKSHRCFRLICAIVRIGVRNRVSMAIEQGKQDKDIFSRVPLTSFEVIGDSYKVCTMLLQNVFTLSRYNTFPSLPVSPWKPCCQHRQPQRLVQHRPQLYGGWSHPQRGCWWSWTS